MPPTCCWGCDMPPPVACVCMCLPDTLSRASLLLGLVSLATLAASIATDHWLYTFERVPNTNNNNNNNNNTNSNTATETKLVRLRVGLWRACPQPARDHFRINDTHAPVQENVLALVTSSMSCTKIPYFKSDFQVGSWTDLALTSFFKRMRLCTPFFLTSLAFLTVGVIVSFVGHVYADSRTFVGSIIFILAGLTLATAIVLYITMISDETLTSKQRERLTYTYGWSFLGAGASFLTGELAALAGISAYLRRFPTAEDIIHLIPGMQRQLVERAEDSESKKSPAHLMDPLHLGASATAPKRDMTVQTFDSIAVPV